MPRPDNTLKGSVFQQLDLNLSGWQVAVAIVAALVVILGGGGLLGLMVLLVGGGR